MSLASAMLKTYGKDRVRRERLERLQQRRLRALVRYAKENSPFYRELYRGVGEDFELSDLPPVTKPELMARFDDVVTDRAVTMARVEAFTKDLDNVGRMLDGKYLVFKTSGSTGHPAVVLYDQGPWTWPPPWPPFGPLPGERILRSLWPTARRPPGSSPITGSTWPAACPGICSLNCRESRPRSPWT